MLYRALKPLLFLLPPEAAHAAAMGSLRLARPLLPAFAPLLRLDDPRLAVKVAGLSFPNRIGLAAGFDKAAEAVDGWQHLGFGHAELGTVTALGQPGNPRPRAFRYPAQQALINRFGFNNPGAAAIAVRLQAYKDAGRWPQHPVGINIGKSKAAALEAAEQDYLVSLGLLAPYADYITVNISSPNTPGLRSLQEAKPVKRLVVALAKALKARRGRRIPLFVKFSPDMEAKRLLASCEAALGAGADGLILTNTTLDRSGLPEGRHPEGGLSGHPLRERADACLSQVAKATRGRVPLIGVGGVFTAEDALRKLDLGASLVQVYTALLYRGPGLARRLNEGLLKAAPFLASPRGGA